MDRQHRHDLKHDKFVDEVGALSVRARENQRVLLALAAGVILIAVAAYGYFFWRSSREQKAQKELAAAIETIEAPVNATPEPGQVQTGPTFKSEAERTAAAEKLFTAVNTNYSGTDAADVAGVYLARFAASKGDNAGARKRYEEFIDDHDDHLLTGAARYSLYQLRIDGGEASQVIVDLNAELGKPEPSLPGDAILVLLAHAYEVQGNAAQTAAMYRRLTTEYPDSAYALEASRRGGQALTVGR